MEFLEEKMKSEKRKNYNRAVIVLILGIFVALWVLINSSEFLTSAFLYIVLGVISIFFYWSWDKFGGFR